ncbi:hypothetical protein C6P40_001032 [Pichia californica]|uniref:Glutamine amidotransferase domain-containing protein n=1 Tax=Pichia californica TaxID=460514 RepID=A0A9P6WJP4_9ASCO|nr:hypothetical protein C6P40_001032 [[Candida] californica]
MSVIKIALILLDDYETSDGNDFADLGKLLIESSLLNYGNKNLIIKFEKFNFIKDIKNLPINPLNFNLIYLTGSRKNSYENNEFNNTLIKFIKLIFKLNNESEHKTKLLGICFGHQIIARALDLETKPNDLGWEMGNTIINNDISNNSIIPSSFIISEMHRDIVIINEFEIKNLKENLNIIIFGKSNICDVQGFLKLNELLTFQGHPEFSTNLTSKMINNRYENGIISKSFYLDSINRNSNLFEDGTDINGNLKLQKFIHEFILN